VVREFEKRRARGSGQVAGELPLGAGLSGELIGELDSLARETIDLGIVRIEPGRGRHDRRQGAGVGSDRILGGAESCSLARLSRGFDI